MFSDRWKHLRGDAGSAGAPQYPSSRSSVTQASRKTNGAGGDVYSRHSNGLEQFFNHIRGEEGLRLLDLAGASQANIAFITNLGCKLYSEDLLQTLDLAFSEGDFFESQSEPARVDQFLASTMEFPEDHFDGVLLWDSLEFLAPPLLKAVIERLRRSVRPGSYLLAMFHADERAGQIPVYSYRIADAHTLLLTPRGTRQPAQFFNNRAVEKLFEGFDSVKFFLTRDSLREVIIKR